MAIKGRRCPRFEHACLTAEGEEVWDAVQRPGAWTGGGMVPRRVDRLAVHARLHPMPVWIVENLLDSFEPAALRAAAVAEKKREKAKPGARRTHAEEGSEND